MANKEIDGVMFKVAPMMAVEALRLKAYLLKTFGPAFGQMLGSVGSISKAQSITDATIDGASLATGIEKLMMNLSEDDFIALLKRLFQNVTAQLTVNGKQVLVSFSQENFDPAMESVFPGRLFSVYPVIGLVLEANYPDFFGKVVRGIGARIARTITSEPDVPKTTSESETSETSEA